MQNSLAGQSIAQVRRAITARLAAAAIDTPDLDARILVGAVLGLDLTGLSVQARRVLTDDEATRLDADVTRRLRGEPVARITGAKEFWGLNLRLVPDTLVPRPDTETVVDAALAALGAIRSPRVADLGTGSGAILLALLSEREDALGIGTDISLNALRAARDNARSLGVFSRATFVACDYGAALAEPFDLIVSNPPYIRSADIATLAIEVRDHDPRRALDGGRDGLTAYRAIAGDALRLLGAGGVLVVEVGHDQSEDVASILNAAGLTGDGPPMLDLGGTARAVMARKLPR